jgi:regulator of PEP synthase PpsR (kinase-PPPase family)
MQHTNERSVFFISDGTGITAETLGLSLLTQFESIHFRQFRLPFVDTVDKAREALAHITATAQADGKRPILVITMVNAELRAIFEATNALCLDMFGTFIQPLAAEIGQAPSQAVGIARSMKGNETYRHRIEAISYSLGHDDGVSDTGLEEAEVILVGVSRCGKTPTSIYLAMQFGIKAANYPLIPEDFERMTLPGVLPKFQSRLFGLTISPERLHRVRSERRPGSYYASLENCRKEVRLAEMLMRQEGINWIDSSSRSIEEISSTILQGISTKT